MQTGGKPPLLESMRALQSALDSYDRESAEVLGLGRNDAFVLRFLVERGPSTPGAIMEVSGLTSGSVTALLDRLEKAGYARRLAHKLDRRSVTIQPTEQGARALAEATQSLSDLTVKLAGRMKDSRGDAVVKQLEDLTRLVDWAGRS